MTDDELRREIHDLHVRIDQLQARVAELEYQSTSAFREWFGGQFGDVD